MVHISASISATGNNNNLESSWHAAYNCRIGPNFDKIRTHPEKQSSHLYHVFYLPSYETAPKGVSTIIL